MGRRKNTTLSPIINGGEMGERIRSFDWTKTTLGPIDLWPQSLKTSVNIVLQSPVPIVMLWGPEGIMIYNDAYSIFAGRRHPFLLGSKVVEGWPEVADFNINVMRKGLKGKTLSYNNQQLTLYRNNIPEEVWMNLNYSPIIDESGKPGGVLAIVVETTQRVLAEQRQKKAEEDLYAERDRLQELFMQAPAVIAVLRGEKHIYELANPLYMQLIGENREVIGKELRKVLPEIEGQGFFELMDKVYTTGNAYIGKEVLVKLDREGTGQLNEVYLNFVYHPIKNNRKKVEGIFVLAVDVTEQVIARRKVEESEERFRTLIEKSTDAIQLVSPNAEIIYTSESIKNVLGYTTKELKGKGVLPFLHPDDVDYFNKNVRTLLEHPEKPITLQYRVKHKDGSWAWLETTGVNHLNTPNINALVGTFRNITKRKEVEMALLESEERFRNMSDTAPVLVWIAGPDKLCTWVNRPWLAFTGRTMKQELGDGWTKGIHPDDLEHSMHIYDKAFNTHEDFRIECRLRRYDGEYRWMLNSGTPRYTSEGTFVGFIGSAIDITDRKMVEHQKDEFLGIASHELKTPVTSIKAYTQALETQFRRKGDERSAERLGKMNTQVDKLSNLINVLLDVTKIQAGKLLFQETFFDFNELVHEIVEEVQRTTEKHTIVTQLDKTKSIYGDRDRIGQVLLNFMTNAIKYSPNAKKIIVSSKLQSKYIVVSVQDFGVGIPKDKQERVFEQFFRVSGAGKETFPGLGLGLYIASQIIQRSGGRIWVESTKGKGSIFYFKLPLNKKKV